jgi:hypothetical protein
MFVGTWHAGTWIVTNAPHSPHSPHSLHSSLLPRSSCCYAHCRQFLSFLLCNLFEPLPGRADQTQSGRISNRFRFGKLWYSYSLYPETALPAKGTACRCREPVFSLSWPGDAAATLARPMCNPPSARPLIHGLCSTASPGAATCSCWRLLLHSIATAANLCLPRLSARLLTTPSHPHSNSLLPSHQFSCCSSS